MATIATIAIIPEKDSSKTATTTTTTTTVTPPSPPSHLNTSGPLDVAPKTSESLTAADTAEEVVITNRKEVLLLEARRARVSWVDASSCPFRYGLTNTNDNYHRNHKQSSSVHNHDDGLSLLESVRVCQSMKSAVNVVKELYSQSQNHNNNSNNSNDPRDVVDHVNNSYERIRHQLDSQIAMADRNKVLISPIPGTDMTNRLSSPKIGNNDDGDDDDDDDVQFRYRYRMFLQTLRSPECAELVQGMRNFVHSFVDMANDTVAMNSLPAAIQSYLETLYSEFRSNPLWQSPTDKNNDNNNTIEPQLEDSWIRMIETFIYSKCYHILWSVLSSNDEMKTKDQSIRDKIVALQFITPKHLEVEYLMTTHTNTTEEEGEENNNNNNNNDWRVLLAKPTQMLQSVNDQLSPGRMLDVILNVYRTVNVILKEALQNKYKDTQKLPGADDLMPALILTVLHAQPQQIASNLHFLEYFASPTQLRGEAGYAFTNLYGAVQFINDLSLDENNDDGTTTSSSISSSFLISPEEFRLGLQQSRDAAHQNLLKSSSSDNNNNHNNKDDDEPNDICSGGEEEKYTSSPKMSNQVLLSVSDLRAARLRGETINLDWAHRWRDNQIQSHKNVTSPRPIGDESIVPHNNNDRSLSLSLSPPPLPEGFSRSYKYLASKPDDIRIRDIPILLEEYQMLVKATESLLAERCARQKEEYRQQIQQTRKRLECDAAEAVLTITPTTGKSSPKK